MATANDFGVARNWVITPDGRWIYGRVDETNLSPGNTISPTPPPAGTPYWTAGSAGDWKLNTYNGDSVVTDYTAPNTPKITPFKEANPNLYPQPTVLTPNQPPPGGWTDQNTYNDIFGKTAPAPPGAVVPQRPGTVPGSVWNNPDSAAPRGYNPELWAQREIGPNRTYAGGITGLGIGGPRNADGTAMYAPPPEYKPTRGIDPFGYEPAPRKQAEFSGFTIGDDGFYRSDRGGSGAAYDENLLRTLKAAADAGEGRANYILSALSTGADMARPVYSAQMNQYGANPIDNYAAQYDWEQEVLGKKEMQRKLKQGWTLGENRQLVPPSGWVEDNNGGWRPPLGDSSWTQVGNGSRWVRTENTSTEPKVPDMGKDDKERKNPFMPRMAKGTMPMRARMRMPIVEYQEPPPGPRFPLNDTTVYPSTYAWAIDKGIDPWSAKNQRQGMRELGLTRPDKRYPNGTMGMNPFVPSFADPTRRMPVYTIQSERVPMPMQRGPAVPGRLPIQTLPVTGRLPIVSGPVVSPAPNPFLGGGASRGYRNPFR